MKPGTLIRATWGGALNHRQELGEVVRYEPDYYGGSSAYTSDGAMYINTTPRRGRVLVLLYSDGSKSWWDEQGIEILDGSSSDGATDR